MKLLILLDARIDFFFEDTDFPASGMNFTQNKPSSL